MTQPLWQLSGSELVAGIRNRQFTCTDVVIGAVTRMRQCNPAINAITLDLGDSAVDQAEELDRRLAVGEAPGPLFGVPVTIKDNVDVAGQRTRLMREWDQFLDRYPLALTFSITLTTTGFRRHLAALFCAACLGAQADGAAPTVEYLDAPGAVARDLPFSEAVRVGHTIYLSGQLGVKPGTLELVPGGIKAETRQTLENIRTTLERHGSAIGDVVKCTAFLADMNEWADMNVVYREFFPDRRPARSAMGVNGLAFDARIELECIAAVPTE
jgi:reactive intermediate/imine deaminase